MKKNHYLRLAACLCIAGLSTCMLSSAKAEAPANLSDSSLLMLQNAASPTDVQLFQSAASAPASILPSPSSGFNLNQSAQAQFATVPVESVNPVLHYSVIPEPTTTACLLVGLGALLGFKRLKIGRSN